MFVHYGHLRNAKLAALEQFQRASAMQIDTVSKVVRLYSDTASLTLESMRSYEASSGLESLRRIMVHVLEGHIHLADHTHQNIIRLFENHAHGVGALTKQTLAEASQFAPPLMEASLGVTESLVSTGESVLDSVGDASIRTIEYIDKLIEQNAGKKRKASSRRTTGLRQSSPKA